MAKRREPRSGGVEPWNEQAKADAKRYGLPEYWILITPVEAQALRDGVVSTKIVEQCEVLLRKGPGE